METTCAWSQPSQVPHSQATTRPHPRPPRPRPAECPPMLLVLALSTGRPLRCRRGGQDGPPWLYPSCSWRPSVAGDGACAGRERERERKEIDATFFLSLPASRRERRLAMLAALCLPPPPPPWRAAASIARTHRPPPHPFYCCAAPPPPARLASPRPAPRLLPPAPPPGKNPMWMDVCVCVDPCACVCFPPTAPPTEACVQARRVLYTYKHTYPAPPHLAVCSPLSRAWPITCRASRGEEGEGKGWGDNKSREQTRLSTTLLLYYYHCLHSDCPRTTIPGGSSDRLPACIGPPGPAQCELGGCPPIAHKANARPCARTTPTALSATYLAWLKGVGREKKEGEKGQVEGGGRRSGPRSVQAEDRVGSSKKAQPASFSQEWGLRERRRESVCVSVLSVPAILAGSGRTCVGGQVH